MPMLSSYARPIPAGQKAPCSVAYLAYQHVYHQRDDKDTRRRMAAAAEGGSEVEEMFAAQRGSSEHFRLVYGAADVRTLWLPGSTGLAPILLRYVNMLPYSALLLDEWKEDLTGLQIWPGALILLSFLTGNAPTLIHGRRKICELGCGTGVVSLALEPRFDRGARVVMTDGHPAMVNVAMDNAKLNSGYEDTTFVSRRLLWGDRPHLKEVRKVLGKTQCADLVLAADCIYDSEVLQPLLWTAAQLLTPPSAATTAAETKTTTKAREGPSATPARPPAFVLSYCGRCLLSDAEFDRRLREIGEGVGLCLVSTTYLADFPSPPLDKETATMMREANARVFVFEPAVEGKPEAT